jgi:hypothetical protein
MKLAGELMAVEGTQLPTVDLYFGEGTANPFQKTNQGWDQFLKSARLLKPVVLSNWLLVFGNREANEANKFKTELIRLARAMGFLISEPIRLKQIKIFLLIIYK